MRKTLELKIFIHALRIDLRILGLIRELKHSNSNMRHQRLNSKGSLFLGHSVVLVLIKCPMGAVCKLVKRIN